MIVVAIVLVVLGILIKHGKMYFLIAGYNTMSKEKQQQLDIAAIATLMRNVMFAMAFLIVLGYFAALWLDNPDIEIIAICVAVAIGLPYLLIQSNSDKYKINNS